MNYSILSPYLIEGFKTQPLSVTPDVPAVGFVKLYQKDDNIWYWLNSSGVETPLGSGGGGGGSSLAIKKDGVDVTTNTLVMNYLTDNFSVVDNAGVADISFGDDLVISNSIGIGTGAVAGQKLHIANGNMLVDGVGENSIIIKRTGTIGTGSHDNPVFSLGRIVGGGIGEPKFRFVYQDDNIYTSEVVCGELEPSGTYASVRQVSGSHIEGFISGESEPLFRINSAMSGNCGIEFGAGGAVATDVHLRRNGVNSMLLALGGGTKQIWYADAVFKPSNIVDAYQSSSTPSTPSSDVVKLYNKSGKMYEINDSGQEYELNNGYQRISQTGHGLALLDPVKHNGTAWVKSTQEDSVGVVVQYINANECVIGFSGKFTITGHGLSVGNYYYISATGNLTLIKPTGFVKEVLFVDSLNTVLVLPVAPRRSSTFSEIKANDGSSTGSTLTNVVWYPNVVRNIGDGLILHSDSFSGTYIEVVDDGMYAANVILYNAGIPLSPTIQSSNVVTNAFLWSENLTLDTIGTNELLHLSWQGFIPAGNYIWVFANSPTTNLGGNIESNTFSVSRIT